MKKPDKNAKKGILLSVDVAFALLIFWVVAQAIHTDTAIDTILPPYVPENADSPRCHYTGNLFSIKINSENEILLHGSLAEYADIKPTIIEFLTNYNRRPDYSENPRLAVVSIQNDNGTDFGAYLTVYNEIKAGYNAVWDAYAQQQFGKSMANLQQWQIDSVKAEFPLLLSESEPTNFGG
jgi:biopolymer transport protein ExbD